MCMVQGNGEEGQETKDGRRRSGKGSVGLDCAGSYQEVRLYPTGDGVLLKDF